MRVDDDDPGAGAGPSDASTLISCATPLRGRDEELLLIFTPLHAVSVMVHRRDAQHSARLGSVRAQKVGSRYATYMNRIGP